MTPPLSDRLKDVQRQYVEMEHNTATLKHAQQAAEKAAWVAENNYRSLTDKCRERIFACGKQVPRGVAGRAALHPERGGDRGGCRRVGGRVDD